jgi:membrane-bound serine protease (ClpP class)
MTAKLERFVAGLAIIVGLGTFGVPPIHAQGRPAVIGLTLDQAVQPISAEYVVRGIHYANQKGAAAVLLEVDTPGGLESSMREIITAIVDSRVPVITYVAPSGSRAASAGFFILLASDLAIMAPGTHAGAAHPVMLGAPDLGKTMEAKVENDAAAYIRSLADKRGRNSKLAEEGVRASKSFTEKEALDGHLIDAIANAPGDIWSRFDGRTLKRFNDSTTTLHLADAAIEPYVMSSRERFLSRLADPNIAFLLGAVGVAGLYIEFTHPGMVAPGVAGGICLILALYGFNLLPINYTGVLLILLALVLFVLEAKLGSHGVLASGGILAMVVGSLILIDTPWPEMRIHLATSLAVTVPLALITVILLRLVIAAQRRKAVTGEVGMIDAVGVAQTDLDLEGKVLVRGEIWEARARQKIPQGARVRVLEINGLILLVEPFSEIR